MRPRIERAIAERGPRHAFEAFIRGNAGDAVFESLDPEVRERTVNNGSVFFELELPAFARFTPDRDRIRASGVPLTVLLGHNNRDTWLGASARWLADGTGGRLVELPGGHGGFWSHPERLAAVVRDLAPSS